MSLSELLRIKREWMAALEAREAGALTRMVDSYAEIANALAAQAEGAWLSIERKRAAGEPVSPSALFQEARIRALLQQAQQQFAEWSDAALAETESLRTSAVRIAGDAVRSELSYLTTPPGDSSSVIGAFDILPVDAINELLAALSPGSPVATLFAHLPAGISTEIRKALTVGLAAGENPRAVGRRMTKASAGGLTNGVRIARTEMMRAYRAAHQANYQRNSDVVQGWIWLSARNSRACAGCLAMHGTFHTLEETLDDHPNGRCTPLPVTKTWAELGYGDRGWQETRVGTDDVERGEDWFARQDAATWESVLGKAGAEAYAAGRVRLVDFAGIQKSPTWGNSIYQRSLADALKAAEVRKKGEPPSGGGKRRAPAPRPAPAGDVGRLKPAGTPVSKALAPEDAIRPLVERLAAAIDKVHGDGVLPALPIRWALRASELPPNVYGQYKRSPKDGRPYITVISELAKQLDNQTLTLAHELGHFIDHAGLGDALKGLGSLSSELETWRNTVFSTKTIRFLETRLRSIERLDSTENQTPQGTALTDEREYLRYLLYPWEVFARSYAQYVAVRSRDAQLLREIDDERRADVYFPTQWADNEFEDVAKAFDEVFQKRGWLKN